MRVDWRAFGGDRAGNAFGYTQSRVQLWAALQRLGVVHDPDAPVMIDFCFPLLWRPEPARVNVLITMYETWSLHPVFWERLPEASLVVAPSRWVERGFNMITPKTAVVPLGVDTRRYRFVRRHRPSWRPFRWLWVGAHNKRKGWAEVAQAWQDAFLFRHDCELYLKTTEVDDQRFWRTGNITTDTRVLEDDELVALYATADGFVFPSMGEGFGLTLLEAMATGLPCVATLYGGVTEFADEKTCLGVDYRSCVMSVSATGYDMVVEPAVRADVPDLIEKMRWIMEHPDRARRMGQRAWQRAQAFTWDAAARKFLDVLARVPGAVTEGEDSAWLSCRAEA